MVNRPRRSRHQAIAALAPATSRATTKAARASPTKAKSPGPSSGRNRRPSGSVSPAQARAKAEKCLANAVYFESRGEPVRGQIAVAQVVMNRVFSPFYPNDVCGVVYQNAHRHLACQFTFACDGVPDVVTEPDAWARAQHIAARHARRQAVDAGGGQVHPLSRLLGAPGLGRRDEEHAPAGRHTFYRPRAWGDGSDEPSWGDAKTTEAEEVKARCSRSQPPNHARRRWLRSRKFVFTLATGRYYVPRPAAIPRGQIRHVPRGDHGRRWRRRALRRFRAGARPW